MYEIGDLVVVRERSPLEHYRLWFFTTMAQKAGQEFKISGKIKSTSPNTGQNIPDDGYNYVFEGMEGYIWASSMFTRSRSASEEHKQETSTKITFGKTKYQLNFNN